MYLTKTALFLLLFLIPLFFVVPDAVESSTANPDLSAGANGTLEEELRWLQAEAVFTEIATKTKIEADLAPGIVTILDGDLLEKRGVRTVKEALMMVPGLDFGITANGSLKPIIRAIGGGPRNIKALLNGIPVNATLQGELVPLYYIPIEQIKRIEVIRGPGSSLYGQWAYGGVINIVTRNDENRLFGRYGRFDAHYGGLIASYKNSSGDAHISLNISGWERDRTNTNAGSDIFAGTGISNAPGPVNDSREAYTVIATLDYKDFYFTGQFSTTDFGLHHGYTGALPPADNNRPQSETTWVYETGWEREISHNINLKINIGLREYEWDSGVVWLLPPGLVTPGDMLGHSHYEEISYYSGVNLHWRVFDRHQLLIGLEFESIEMRDIWQSVNYDPLTLAPLPDLTKFKGDKNWLDENRGRDILGVFLQDQIKISHRFTLNLGVRYDNYQDTDDKLSPRIAAVFRATDNHIFKLQYAEAFRPPSFLEMYSKNNPTASGYPDLEPELIDTWEFQYIYKRPAFSGKVALFYSDLEKMIVLNADSYSNIGNARIRGGELEFTLKPGSFLMLDANISYSDTEDSDTGRQIVGIANWLGSLGITYYPYKDFSLSLREHYVGKHHRDVQDKRPKMDDYSITSIAAGYEDLFFEGFTFRIGVNNLLKGSIKYTAANGTYPHDYQQPGREWWAQFSYEF